MAVVHLDDSPRRGVPWVSSDDPSQSALQEREENLTNCPIYGKTDWAWQRVTTIEDVPITDDGQTSEFLGRVFVPIFVQVARREFKPSPVSPTPR
jgi:hypothetical protein